MQDVKRRQVQLAREPCSEPRAYEAEHDRAQAAHMRIAREPGAQAAAEAGDGEEKQEAEQGHDTGVAPLAPGVKGLADPAA